jgi:hypothetical protein
MMKQPIVVVGLGNLGGVFSTGFLRIDHPVYPVNLGVDPGQVARQVPEPQLALVSVAEDELHPFLEAMPETWRSRAGFVQNELLPRDWETHQIPNPTVAAVWFEKRANTAPMVYFSTPVYGPQAQVIVDAFQSMDIPAHIVIDPERMLLELVRKNMYIVSKNIAGLVAPGGNVGELWKNHQELFQAVAEDVFEVQQFLANRSLPRQQVLNQMVKDIEELPGKNTAGSSAPGRLRRTLRRADEGGLAVPRLREIQKKISER